MISLNNDENTKLIQFTLNDNITCNSNRDMYVIDMPVVACSNIKDAEIMQHKINTFVNDLSKTLLK